MSASQKPHDKIISVIAKTDDTLDLWWLLFDANVAFFFAPFHMFKKIIIGFADYQQIYNTPIEQRYVIPFSCFAYICFK